jgi:hypothetical protein
MIRNTGQLNGNEHALTGLEIVVLLVVAILIIGYLGYGEISHGKTPPVGTQQKQNRV